MTRLKWTRSMKKFVGRYAAGHTRIEIAGAVSRLFSVEVTWKQVADFMTRNGIKNGLAGCPKSKILPIGAESRASNEEGRPDGYVTVKTASGWRLKHHVVWEEANGKPVPKGAQVMFADGDSRNFDPSNLVAVPRATAVKINQMGLEYHDAESLRTCIAIAELKTAVNRRNNAHGSPTNPRKKRQSK